MLLRAQHSKSMVNLYLSFISNFLSFTFTQHTSFNNPLPLVTLGPCIGLILVKRLKKIYLVSTFAGVLAESMNKEPDILKTAFVFSFIATAIFHLPFFCRAYTWLFQFLLTLTKTGIEPRGEENQSVKNCLGNHSVRLHEENTLNKLEKSSKN